MDILYRVECPIFLLSDANFQTQRYSSIFKNVSYLALYHVKRVIFIKVIFIKVIFKVIFVNNVKKGYFVCSVKMGIKLM